MENRIKLIRTTTIPGSMVNLIKGQLKFLNEHFEVVAISGGGEKLELIKNRENIRVVPIKMEREIRPISDIISLIKLYKCFKSEKPHIVHSITPKAGLLTMMAGYMAKVPIRIHTFTGLIFPTSTGIKKKILIAMDKLLCYCATHIFPEGQGVKNDLIKYKITDKSLKIIANGNVNGIDTEHFDPNLISEEKKITLKSELGIKNDDFVFIYIGRMVKDKGINELIAAFKEVNQVNENTKLLLVGDFEPKAGNLKNKTEEEIKNNPSIIAVGYQSDVRPYFAISDVLTFPSYREGFPNVVLQAGSMELPAIVSNISGCNEIITNEVNGEIIPPADERALLNAMVKSYMNKGELTAMGKNSRIFIIKNFQSSLVWHALLNEYKQLI
jgi:glycosyltransferase involved in cell wall biosynthesis